MTLAARVTDRSGPKEQRERLSKLGEVVRERAALEARLLLLDAEEASLLSFCEHCDEEGEGFTDPLCPICEAPLV